MSGCNRGPLTNGHVRLILLCQLLCYKDVLVESMCWFSVFKAFWVVLLLVELYSNKHMCLVGKRWYEITYTFLSVSYNLYVF